jgi:hypothetical protein
MSHIEKKAPEIMLTDIAGAETLLQIRLPLIIVEKATGGTNEVYRFQDTQSGDASGVVISELVVSEDHYLDKDTIKSLGVNRISSLAKTAGNINKSILPFAGYSPIEVQRESENTYGFGGLKLHPVEDSVKAKMPKSDDRYLGYIPTPLESRLKKSGVDIAGMTLAEKRVVDSLRSRAGVHLNIEAIIELLNIDYNVAVTKEYVAKTLSNLLQRSKSGRLPDIQFRVISGDLRVEWQLEEILRGEAQESNQPARKV